MLTGYLASNYTYLRASLSAPLTYAVDPDVVDANGGVSVGQVDPWMASHPVGTGPSTLQGYNGVGGGGYELIPVSNFWGPSAAAAEPWDLMIQPARTAIEVVFQDSIDIVTGDLLAGEAATASFAYLGPSTVDQLEGNPCLVVHPLSTI